jgi:uncharacterized protein
MATNPRVPAHRYALPVRILALLAVAALACAALALTGCTKVVTTSAAGSQSTVTASGTGKVSATPDTAVMSFGVTAKASDPRAALDSVSKTAQSISSAVQKAGVDQKDIQTQNVSVYPITTVDNNGKEKVDGYQASIQVTAKVKDLSSLGKVISAANAAGANTISGPTFSVADDTAYTQAATKKAVDDARKSAEAMAKAAGRSLGKVVSVSSQPVATQPVPYATADIAGAAKSAEVPIEPGQLDVSANVTVVWELK